MKKQGIGLLIILACIFSQNGKAQKSISPQKLHALSPIQVSLPVMLDSINLKQKRFTKESLLDYNISFPQHARFNTILQSDANDTFNIPKPEKGDAIQLISFYINADRYGKGTLTVISPNALQVWMNNKKIKTKQQTADSLHRADSVNVSLDGFLNNPRIVIKMLTSADNNIIPTLKIKARPNKEDSLLQYSFNENQQRRITIEDILDGKRVTSSSISPNAKYVLLHLQETFPGGKTVHYHQVYDIRSKRVILSEMATRKQLKWMPQSDVLWYIANGENGKTMYCLNPATAETKKLAEHLPDETFYMAPDEKSIFYSTKETVSSSSPKGLKRLIGIDDRQSNYRDRYFLYQYFFETGLAQNLTFGQKSAVLNDITKDATRILFSVTEEDLSERPFRKSSMYMLHLPTMQMDTLWEKQSYAYSAQFSPDEKNILIHGAPEAFESIGAKVLKNQIANSYDTQSFMMHLATKRVEPLTRDFDPTIDAQQWCHTDGHIYYRVQDKECENVYRYNTQSRKFEKLSLQEDVIRSFSIASNAPWATYTGVSASNSNRCYLLSLKTLESRLISDPYDSRLQELNLGEVNEWNFKSSYGDTIEGRFYLPPNFNPQKKYPLIVYYYGGTSPTQRVFESTYPLHVYAAQDYVVYTLNPSGTTGYGQEFAARHVNAWGKQTAEEIIEGVKKFVAAHPFVDGSKIGNIGASYGGFMTQYLITQSDIFAASVSHAGISNITSYWGEGYWGYSYSAGASAGSFPWNNPEMYVRQSPLFHADKITTPLLLLHGTADTNVPIGESIQMYNALKLLNKPVEFIQVEGENHAIYQYDKRIAWNHAIYAWFAKWLKGDPRWWDSMYPEK